MLSRLCGAVIVGVLLAGCQSPSSGSGPRAEPAPGPNTVVVEQGQNGETVTLKPGQTLLVRLPEEPARGMAWEMEQMPAASILTPDGTRVVHSGQQLKDSSLLAYQELRFQAQTAGTTTLSLAYDNPQQGSDSITRRFTLKVSVE
ncbi:MAG: protease inhibitor I42 family protein [Phycisphaerales bacterium]|nr:protease inhibitor I42 family protein [Phycisphaerales bacterium]